MAKGAEEVGNAYATQDDWTLSSEALATSIRQHSAILNGEDQDIELADNEQLDSRPLRREASLKSLSQRSFNTLDETQAESFSSRGAGRPSLATSRPGMPNRHGQPPSALRGTRRYDGQYQPAPPGKRTAIYTNKPKGTGTKIRAMIALICLTIAILLAVLLDHGATGRWLTHVFIGTIPGSTATKEVPIVGGIPPAIGQASPAFSGNVTLPDLAAMNIMLPDAIENGYSDWRIPFPAVNRTDLPVLWQLAKNGGTVVQRILGQCLGLVEVSQEGKGHDEKVLKILETSTGTRYMNVDPTTLDGLVRAKALGLISSALADVLYTPLIVEAANSILDPSDPEHHGRLFGIFRHPLERSMAIYESAKATDTAVAQMSLEDFAKYRLPNNEMVRTLAAKGLQDTLTDDDLHLAMEILRRKCVVGLVDRMEDSMKRFHGYFGWHSLLVEGVVDCQSKLLAPGQKLPAPKKDSPAYTLMVNQNRLDLQLYEYILYLYDVQGGTARVQ